MEGLQGVKLIDRSGNPRVVRASEVEHFLARGYTRPPEKELSEADREAIAKARTAPTPFARSFSARLRDDEEPDPAPVEGRMLRPGEEVPR